MLGPADGQSVGRRQPGASGLVGPEVLERPAQGCAVALGVIRQPRLRRPHRDLELSPAGLLDGDLAAAVGVSGHSDVAESGHLADSPDRPCAARRPVERRVETVDVEGALPDVRWSLFEDRGAVEMTASIPTRLRAEVVVPLPLVDDPAKTDAGQQVLGLHGMCFVLVLADV